MKWPIRRWLISALCVITLIAIVFVAWRICEPRITLERIMWALKGHDFDEVSRLVEGAASGSSRSRMLELAEKRFRSSRTRETAAWMILFDQIGHDAAPFLEEEYGKCESDHERSLVLQALASVTEDPGLVPRLYELLFSNNPYVVRETYLEFWGLSLLHKDGQIPFIDYLRTTDPTENAYERAVVTPLFESWWNDNKGQIMWQGEKRWVMRDAADDP